MKLENTLNLQGNLSGLQIDAVNNVKKMSDKLLAPIGEEPIADLYSINRGFEILFDYDENTSNTRMKDDVDEYDVIDLLTDTEFIARYDMANNDSSWMYELDKYFE